MKEKESKLAFICFHLFLGIGTFQRVTAKKIKKIFPFLARATGWGRGRLLNSADFRAWLRA
jgi:hypothetical protein